MHFVPIEKLEPGMITVKRIYDENGVLMLNSNKVLTNYNISQIKKLGYQGLYIYDELSQLDSMREIIDEDIRRQTIKSLKVFNLDAITMLDILHDIENMGMIKIIRTAGLDVIHLNQQLTFIECVERYYQSITEGE